MFEYLRHNLLPCPLKQLTGIDCPGCGMQRAIVELFDGNILLSLKYYPALIPIIFMLVFLFAHLRFDFKNGTIILKILFLLNGLLILTNYIVKLYNSQLL
ncbi:MAG: DUF2752 domain-containing protein [Bacteroidales bacterium]|nr:DUF2752 domain-containing protein [Bacteroidales bacterium]